MSRPRVVVAGWSGTTNVGDELLLRALLDRIDRQGAEAVVVSRDPAGTTRDHGVAALGLGDVVGLVRELRRGAGLVLGPGGIISDQASVASLPWHLARSAEAAVARAPMAGIGLGVGPLDRRGSRALVRLALRRNVALAVRDQASADLLAACGVHGAEVGGDLALGLEPTGAEPIDRIVVALRPVHRGRGRVPLRRLTDADLDTVRIARLAAGIDALAASSGLPVHFVAFERGRDDRYQELVAARMRSRCTASTPALDHALAEVARSRVVVAMRFHAGVAALLAGRPMVLLAYAPKVTALGDAVGRGARVLPDDASGYARLASAVDEVAVHHGDVLAARDRLRATLAPHDRALERLLDAIDR